MIKCANCGVANDPDATFCQACHHFLAWEDAEPRRPAPPVAPEPEAEPEPDPEPEPEPGARARARA